MWKQIIPADDIFIHEENSSWKMLPRTNSNCNRSGPMQVQSFKKAAASELPNFSGLLHSKSVPPASPVICPRQHEHGQGGNGLGDEEGPQSMVGRATGKQQRESAFKGWCGARPSPRWSCGKQWPCVIFCSSFSSGPMWKGQQPPLQQLTVVIIHDPCAWINGIISDK